MLFMKDMLLAYVARVQTFSENTSLFSLYTFYLTVEEYLTKNIALKSNNKVEKTRQDTETSSSQNSKWFEYVFFLFFFFVPVAWGSFHTGKYLFLSFSLDWWKFLLLCLDFWWCHWATSVGDSRHERNNPYY